MTELIITEKPKASQKIAEALADGSPVKHAEHGVPYYEIRHNGKRIIVGCAVGHLYTVAEKAKSWKYPVFEVEWKPTADIAKGADFTKKYLQVLKKLAKEADEFTVACDYDVEGEVIGLNVIRYACSQKDAARMKFSTLTKPDIVAAYERKSAHLDWGQANAGLTRHELDWYYGINISRALTDAIKAVGAFKVMSAGRVQGPALKIIVDLEKEIRAFVPQQFWQVSLKGELKGSLIEAWHEKDKFWKKEEAEQVVRNTKGKPASVKEVAKTQTVQSPPVPFDLTTLQTEAFRNFRIPPKETLAIAQELYVSGYISYPRTSSQKLPKEIGYHQIMRQLTSYTNLAAELLTRQLAPNEGKKTDPAHPAIFPTGIIPDAKGRELKVYDLIVKRFLATFADPALRETMSISIGCNAELFIAKGTRTVERGWHRFYDPYVRLEELELPSVQKGDMVKDPKITAYQKETQPPKRYTAASIIRELEKRNLGTKATRAQIIDTLEQRGFITGSPIQATEIGIHTVEVLEKYVPAIVDEELTRHFEEEMEEIRERKKQNEAVLSEAKGVLGKTLLMFKQQEKVVGKELLAAEKETRLQEKTIGTCPKCGGVLMIRKGKYGRFVACDRYPTCTLTFNLPDKGKVTASEKVCPACSSPIIVMSSARRKQEVCINKECPLKKSEGIASAGKSCPKCGKQLITRKSIYGEFFGCSGFPSCRYTERLPAQEKTGAENQKK
ncbi:DNA topoisomerase I [Candidatus Woesearchaeota archaeon]|nr:DNA topoisomerase I [Candidatus Woesearchaeota archaeon]